MKKVRATSEGQLLSVARTTLSTELEGTGSKVVNMKGSSRHKRQRERERGRQGGRQEGRQEGRITGHS